MYNICFGALSFLITSFYSFQFQDIEGNNINMNVFHGKKVLIVNIGTSSYRIKQLIGLQQVYQQHHDSLVVIAFPSNDFGNEHNSDSTINSICRDSIGVQFLIAKKVNVKGINAHPLFYWLAHKEENGSLDAEAKADFQKYLISKEGKLVAVLSPKIEPLSSYMIEAITASY